MSTSSLSVRPSTRSTDGLAERTRPALSTIAMMSHEKRRIAESRSSLRSSASDARLRSSIDRTVIETIETPPSRSKTGA